jgi:hypothetical protein
MVMTKPLQWEYHLQPLPGDFKLISPTLFELGALGWELVGFQLVPMNGLQMFFKRPREAEPSKKKPMAKEL